MTKYNLDDVVEELKELTTFFNERVTEIKQKYLSASDALQILHKFDGSIGFSLDIDKIK